MVTKRKRKSKGKKKRKARTEKKQTRLNQLKIAQEGLYSRCNDNWQVIRQNTGMDKDTLASFVRNNGYEGLRKLPNLDIAEPILNHMIKLFKHYDELDTLIERRQILEDKLLFASIKKETQTLEAEVKAIDEEEKLYTQLPDKEGFVQMKEKYHVEKEHWEIKKAEAEAFLVENPGHDKAVAQLEEAKKQLKILSKKRRWAMAKNLQPNIAKYTGKITKGIHTIQDSMGEISKPFQEVGKKDQQGNEFADMFTPEKIFGKKKNQSTEQAFGGGF